MSLVQSLHHIVGLSLDPIRNQNGYIARKLTADTRDGVVFELPLFAETEEALQLPIERVATDLLAALRDLAHVACTNEDMDTDDRAEFDAILERARAAISKAEA